MTIVAKVSSFTSLTKTQLQDCPDTSLSTTAEHAKLQCNASSWAITRCRQEWIAYLPVALAQLLPTFQDLHEHRRNWRKQCVLNDSMDIKHRHIEHQVHRAGQQCALYLFAYMC